jgi:hypothetical protein
MNVVRHWILPALVALPLVTGTWAVAADLRPSWECLPEETAVMVRLPQPEEFVAALRERTKFGATVLGEQRLKRVWQLFLDKFREDGAGEQFDTWEQELGKYGLQQADLTAALAHDLGFGAVVVPRDEGRPPLQMLLMWLEPGADPAGRMFAAIKQMLEERAAEESAPKRVDLEMAGHEVVWVQEKQMGLDVAAITADEDDDEDAEDGFEQRLAKAELVQTGVSHSFVTRIGGRLLVGQTIPPTAGGVGGVGGQAGGGDGGPGGAAGGDRDWDAESGVEEAKGVFERFLAAHAAAGAAPVAEVFAMPGVREALPEGLAAIDVMVNPRVFVKAFAGAGPEAEEERRRLESIGLDAVGPFVWRQALDGGRYHNGMFFSLPGPRRGLMRILDQECDTSEPPSFVTSEVTDLTQFSLDLGKAYQTVREVLVAAGGEEAGNMFNVAEMQAQGWLGLDLPTVLSALGSRHWMLAYPSKIADAIAVGRAAGNAGQQLNAANRGAIVWQVTDEAPFLKILQRLAPLAGGELIEEQGFRGFRVPNGPAVFLGMNHLVIGIGDESLEKTIAGIRNPPAGAASLREGELMRRAAALLPLDPARMFSVGDAAKTGGMLGNLREIAVNMEPEDVPEDYRKLFAGLKETLPTAADMEGMFGASAATMRMTDAGLAIRSVWEMPPP